MKDDELQQKRLRNYQLMFKTALACLAISLVTTLLGGLKAAVDSEVEWFVFGLLMLVWSVGSAYLTIDSTVRIIEGETRGA